MSYAAATAIVFEVIREGDLPDSSIQAIARLLVEMAEQEAIDVRQTQTEPKRLT